MIPAKHEHREGSGIPVPDCPFVERVICRGASYRFAQPNLLVIVAFGFVMGLSRDDLGARDHQPFGVDANDLGVIERRNDQVSVTHELRDVIGLRATRVLLVRAQHELAATRRSPACLLQRQSLPELVESVHITNH